MLLRHDGPFGHFGIRHSFSIRISAFDIQHPE
jgi:hypothetical protein